MNDKLLALVMGKEWHEWTQVKNRESGNLPFEHLCLCGHSVLSNREVLHGVCSPNPDYSDPRHRDEFFAWLCRERPEMWIEFYQYAFRQYLKDETHSAFVPWLFFSDPARPRDLMAEWLQLPEVVNKFGWEEYPNLNPNPRDINCLNWNESCHCRNSKVLSEWARYVKEGK